MKEKTRLWLVRFLILIVFSPVWMPTLGLAGMIAPGGGGVQLQDEGTPLGSISTLNCTGDLNCSAASGTGTATVAAASPPANLYVKGHLFPVDIQNTAIPSSTSTSGWLTSGNCPTNFNQCLALDGTNDWAFVTGKDSGSGGWTAFTVDFQIYVTNVSTNGVANFLDKRDVGGGTPQVFVVQQKANSGIIRFFSNVFDFETSSSVLTINTWYRVRAVYDDSLACGSGKVKIRLNGTDQTLTQTSCTGGAVTTVTNSPISIGSRQGAAAFVNGRIDDIALWDAAKTGDNSSECPSSGGNIVLCVHFNGTDAVDGTIALQSAAVPGIGSDSNDGLTTSTACLNPEACLSKVPSAFTSNCVLNIATGTYPTSILAKGLSRKGNANCYIRGYINATSNSFTNSPYRTSTFTSTPATDHTDRAILTDSTASFASSDSEVWLEITGGGSSQNGFCSGGPSGFDNRNWYMIENNRSTTTLAIVTTFAECGMPANGTQYKLYDPKDQTTIHGAKIRNYGIQIEDSRGINSQQMRVVYPVVNGIYIFNSIASEVAGNVVQYSARRGIHMDGGSLESEIANFVSDDNNPGIGCINSAKIASQRKNFSVRNSISGTGGAFTGFLGCVITVIKENLAKQDGYTGFDYEQNFQNYGFQDNWAISNAVRGLVVSTNSAVALTGHNTFDGQNGVGDAGIRIGAYGVLILDMLEGGTVLSDIRVTNNSRGVHIEKEGLIFGALGSMTFTGTSMKVFVEDSASSYRLIPYYTYQFDDFTTNEATASGQIGAINWFTSVSGASSAPTIISGESAHNGLIRLTEGSVGASHLYLCTPSCSSTTRAIVASDAYDITLIVRNNQIDTNVAYKVGLKDDTVGSNIPPHGIWFRKDGFVSAQPNACATANDTNFFAVTSAAGTRTSTDTGIAATTSFFRFRIQKAEAGTAYFWIGDSVVAVNSANLPTANLEPFFFIQNCATSGTRTMDIDMYAVGISGWTR